MLLGVGSASQVAFPVFGGTLLVQFLPVTIPLLLGGTTGVAGAGSASLPVPLSTDPSTVGVNLNFQAWLLDAGASFGLSHTNAIEMWIG